MKDYIAVTSQSLMTLPEDNTKAVRWPLCSLLAYLCWLPYRFPAAMPKFKGDRKMYRNSANFE
jgi:hypothetical protein